MEPKITGFVGANAIVLDNASHDTIGAAYLSAGAKIESNGYYAQAEGGYGTAAYAKIEAGKDFTFGSSNFGVNTSIGGQYIRENKTKDYYTSKFEEGANSPTWKANDLRGYGNVSLTYKNSVVEAGLGVRGGVKTSTQPSLDGITLVNVGETKGTEYQGRTTKAFVEPTANLGVNLGKGWKIALQAAPSQGSLGVSWNF